MNPIRPMYLALVGALLALSTAAPAQSLEDLIRAIQEVRPEVVRKLVDDHPDLVKQKDGRGHSALLRASYLKRTDFALFLIERGADVEGATERGTRPLHAACFAGASDIVRGLLSANAQVDPLDGGGRTPLHWAAWKGHAGIVEQLLVKQAALNVRDEYGQTPLHLAARAGLPNVVSRLLQAGALVRAQDFRGRLAIDWCRSGKHGQWQEVEQLLLQAQHNR